jgi:hypothetical protein
MIINSVRVNPLRTEVCSLFRSVTLENTKLVAGRSEIFVLLYYSYLFSREFILPFRGRRFSLPSTGSGSL